MAYQSDNILACPGRERYKRPSKACFFFLRTCPVIKSEKLFVERWRKVHSRFSEDPVMLQMAQCTKFRIGQLAASSHGCSEHSLGWWDPLGNDGILSDVEGAVLTSVL